MRNVQWPVYGDRAVFRRVFATTIALGSASILCAAVAAGLLLPSVVATLIPLSVAVVLLFGLWAHSHAQCLARRAEIVNSFAGLTVIHHGQAIRISDTPLVGEYDTRREANRVAMHSETWAVIVRAYDRYFVLSGAPTRSLRTPVAFRTRAVADVVPALIGDQLSA